jgi:hypothetical protein
MLEQGSCCTSAARKAPFQDLYFVRNLRTG